MAENECTAARARELLNCDENGVLTLRVSTGYRGCHKAGKIVGFYRGDNRFVVSIDNRHYMAHRVVWLLTHGTWPKLGIDHIDGNPRNNKPSNLRDVTQTVNLQNQKKPRADNTSGYLGVCYDKRRATWYSQIIVNGKHVYLGAFNRPEKAHEAYLSAKRRLHEGCTI